MGLIISAVSIEATKPDSFTPLQNHSDLTVPTSTINKSSNRRQSYRLCSLPLFHPTPRMEQTFPNGETSIPFAIEPEIASRCAPGLFESREQARRSRASIRVNRGTLAAVQFVPRKARPRPIETQKQKESPCAQWKR